MSTLAKIHIAKKQLRLDDETYRQRLLIVTGKTSTREMHEGERAAVLQSFIRDGFEPRPKGASRRGETRRSGPAAKHAAKIEALWLSGWNLGVIRDPSSAAMEAFILRQTGIAKAQWLKDTDDAGKVIEALKAWLTREGGVKWSFTDERGKTIRKDPQDAVIDTQCLCLLSIGVPSDFPNDMSKIQIQQHFGKIIRKAQAEGQF